MSNESMKRQLLHPRGEVNGPLLRSCDEFARDDKELSDALCAARVSLSQKNLEALAEALRRKINAVVMLLDDADVWDVPAARLRTLRSIETLTSALETTTKLNGQSAPEREIATHHPAREAVRVWENASGYVDDLLSLAAEIAGSIAVNPPDFGFSKTTHRAHARKRTAELLLTLPLLRAELHDLRVKLREIEQRFAE